MTGIPYDETNVMLLGKCNRLGDVVGGGNIYSILYISADDALRSRRREGVATLVRKEWRLGGVRGKLAVPQSRKSVFLYPQHRSQTTYWKAGSCQLALILSHSL